MGHEMDCPICNSSPRQTLEALEAHANDHFPDSSAGATSACQHCGQAVPECDLDSHALAHQLEQELAGDTAVEDAAAELAWGGGSEDNHIHILQLEELYLDELVRGCLRDGDGLLIDVRCLSYPPPALPARLFAARTIRLLLAAETGLLPLVRPGGALGCRLPSKPRQAGGRAPRAGSPAAAAHHRHPAARHAHRHVGGRRPGAAAGSVPGAAAGACCCLLPRRAVRHGGPLRLTHALLFRLGVRCLLAGQLRRRTSDICQVNTVQVWLQQHADARQPPDSSASGECDGESAPEVWSCSTSAGM